MFYCWLMFLKMLEKTCYSYYKLDPANYISALGLAWDAMLLKTRIKLDLITDLKMLNMKEKQKRGIQSKPVYIRVRLEVIRRNGNTIILCIIK